MKSITKKPFNHRYFLLFILAFAYVQSIYTRIIIWQQINVYIFTPEAALGTTLKAAVLFVVILFFIKKWHGSNIITIKELLQIFGLSLLIYVSSIKIIGLLIAFVFGTVERNFNPNAFTISLFADFLDGIIYGAFLLAYYYHRNNRWQYDKLVKFNDTLAKSKINQLKNQLNPHFLFNNLNILDQFIHEDKEKASEFLNEFSEIYRYVLKVSERQLVTIDEETDFVRQYFNLVRHRYGNAFKLNFDIKNRKCLIVPLTLQLLVENVMQHNMGTQEQPVVTDIVVDDYIQVSNNVFLKKRSHSTSGRGLKNLGEQYLLLAKKPIEIESSEDKFSIRIPIINSCKP